MKKLIALAAVATCGAALAVESANIVGYQLIAVPTGYNLFTPTFEGVSGNLDLTSIEICDAEGNVNSALYNDVGIQKMDTEGAYLDVYGYCPDVGGWNVAFTPIEAGTVTFGIGETMCVANDSGATVYFRVSGQVDLVNKNEVGTGYVLWGNSTPVAVDLTDISVVDIEGNVNTALYNDVGIQKMDTEGAYLDVYGYCPDVGGWNVAFTPIEAGTVTLQPGEAVCVANDSGSTVYFKLPSPVGE